MRTVSAIFRDAAILDSDGRHINGSDKMSNHNYGDAYEGILGPMRLWADLIMEIGIADGSSLLAWAEVFPYALCVGLDIHHSDKAHGDRIEFHFGDQRCRADCERAAAGRLFDVIIEDATHHLPDTLLTLYWLWPRVKPGGLYIVEEWDGVSGDRDRIKALWPGAEIVGTCGPYIQDEPLVVFRKPK